MASRTRVPSKISGQVVKVSGEHVFVESGVHVVVPDVSVSGSIVQISGQHVYVESGLHVVPESGQHVLISGQHVFVESGVQVVATVDISGQPVKISGEHVYVESGVYTASGVGVQVQSGVGVQVQSGVIVASGLNVVAQSGLGVLISGQHVFVESGVFVASGVGVLVSGQLTTTSGIGVTVQSGVWVRSGLGVLMSGQMVQQASGAYNASGVGVIINSGVGVTVASGLGVLISGQHVFVESGVYLASGIFVVAAAASGTYAASGVGVIINSGVGVTVQSGLYLASGLKIGVSGEFIPVGGMDYIQSGTAVMGSGQYRMATTMKASESAVSGFEARAEEARLFTGADAKHIRFHENFDAKELDPVKWVMGTGTVTVANGIADMSSAVDSTEFWSRARFLFGVLSLEVKSDNIHSVTTKFGFAADPSYSQGSNCNLIIQGDGAGGNEFIIQKPMPGETSTAILPALLDDTWYHIDIVWTPSYCQVWIDGKLRTTIAASDVPMSPANIYFMNNMNEHLYIADVSLKPYGDIPLTVWGAVPVAGMDLSGSYVPIAVDASGHILISGQHVYVESGVYLASGLYVVAGAASGTYMASGVGVVVQSGVGVLISGQHVFVESGVYLASGVGVTVDPAHLSGLRLISGQSVTIASGLQVIVQSGVILMSGYINATWLSGLYLASGQSLVSGQAVIVGTATLSGLRLISGQSVTIDPATLSGLRLISGQSVTIASGLQVIVQSGVILMSGFLEATWLSGLRLLSGGSILISGQGVIVGTTTLSGLFLRSGSEVTIFPATLSGLYLASGVWLRSGTVVQVDAPGSVLAQVSNNPMTVGALSGGVNLISATCVSVTVKALSINSGDIYVGGGVAGHMPYSGQGFLLEPGEAINIDVDNMGLVRSFAEVSADRVTFLAVNG